MLPDEYNGIVESEVNTTKLTKRIMYGRSSFELIKNKTRDYSHYVNNYWKEPNSSYHYHIVKVLVYCFRILVE